MPKQPPDDPCDGLPLPDLRTDPVPTIVQGVPFTLTGTIGFGNRLDVQLGGEPFQLASVSSTDQTNTYVWSYKSSTLSPGPLTITLKAYYKKCPGLATQGQLVTTVQADTTPPSITVSPINPVNVPEGGAGSAIISGTANDNQSGVASVEWNTPIGLLLGAGWNATTQQAPGWASWQVKVTFILFGPNEIFFRARDRAGNTSQIQTVTVQGLDNTPPTVTITKQPPAFLSSALDDAIIVVEGTAVDGQSGVKTVEWRLENETEFAQVPNSPPWSPWRIQFKVRTPALGDRPVQHTIVIRSSDNAGNSGVTTPVVFQVERAYKAEDPTSLRAYLAALIEFATNRIQGPDGKLIDEKALEHMLYQPFNALLDPSASLADQPVRQVRIGVEVLRRYLANQKLEIPPAADQMYRQTAYVTLLKRLGTSYEEMRLARRADADTRNALADRLNIDPVHLDDLFLLPDQLAKDVLQKRFGLAAVTDATPPPAANPDFVIWQLARLHQLWSQQDANQPFDGDIPIVVDPDRVGREDLRDPAPGTPPLTCGPAGANGSQTSSIACTRNGWRPALRPTALSS